jgi:GNAT superfamily N-acetyltransferase
MAAKVFLESDAARKRALQERLAAELPAWFGKAEANAAYAAQAEVLDGFVAEFDGVGCGLLLLKNHGSKSAEIYWMAVAPAFHRRGVGHALVDAAAGACRQSGRKYLFVATLHPDDPYEPYQGTRRFYESMRFVYVLEEQTPADPDNPLAYYLRDL